MMRGTGASKYRKMTASLVAAALVMGIVGQASAALCVWRNPDADIKEFFGGGTYRTVLVKVGKKKATIEKAIGTELDSDESELKFWPVMKDGKRVGTVASHLGKGDYGAVEVLMTVVESGGKVKIKGVKIQRDRERQREALRSSKFLDQFKGKTAKSTLTVGKDIKAAHPSAQRASKIVALSVKKMLTAYEVLGVSKL